MEKNSKWILVEKQIFNGIFNNVFGIEKPKFSKLFSLVILTIYFSSTFYKALWDCQDFL